MDVKIYCFHSKSRENFCLATTIRQDFPVLYTCYQYLVTTLEYNLLHKTHWGTPIPAALSFSFFLGLLNFSAAFYEKHRLHSYMHFPSFSNKIKKGPFPVIPSLEDWEGVVASKIARGAGRRQIDAPVMEMSNVTLREERENGLGKAGVQSSRHLF